MTSTHDTCIRPSVSSLDKSSAMSKDGTIITEYGYRGTPRASSAGQTPTLSQLNSKVPPKILVTADNTVLFAPQLRGQGHSITSYGKHEVSHPDAQTTRFEQTGSGYTIDVCPTDENVPGVELYLEASQARLSDWKTVRLQTVRPEKPAGEAGSMVA